MTDRDQVVPVAVGGEEQAVSMTVRSDDPVRMDVEKVRAILVPGADDYTVLDNKPQIEGVVLVGDKSFEQLGMRAVTPQEIDNIIYG